MKRFSFIAALLMCVCGAVAQSAPSPSTPPTAAQLINRQISGIEHDFVPLVEAMPADKFDFAPTNGEFKDVRPFGKMVKHAAVTNVLVASAILGQDAPKLTDEEKENGPENVKTKEQIVQYLKDSFAMLHKAADGATDANLMSPLTNIFGGKAPLYRLGLFIFIAGHNRDHYGQLVEYLRDNGKIPPASQPAPPPAKK